MTHHLTRPPYGSPNAIVEHPIRDPLADRLPFFYGWLMLLLATVAQIATSPGQTFSVSMFSNSISAELKLSEFQLTGAYALGTFLACLPLTAVGAWMDRFGIRRTMSVVVLLFGGACIFMSQVTGAVTLFLAFFLLRLLGQGALSLLAANTVAMWFHARLGRVSAVMSIAVVAAAAVILRLIRWLIETVGWRWAYADLGLLVWCVMLPLLAVFFRNRPEDVGQVMDGKRQPAERHDDTRRDSPAARPVDFDLPAALRTRSYWIVLLTCCVWAMVITGLIFNVQRVYQLRGLGTNEADWGLTAFFVSFAVMQVIGGLLADRARLNLVMSASMAGMAVAAAVLCAGVASWTTGAYILFGASQGVLGPVGNTVWARYFGRAHLGKIRGSIMTATVGGSSLGPVVMGFTYDRLGTYQPVLILFLALLVPLVVATLLATPPKTTPTPTGRGSG